MPGKHEEIMIALAAPFYGAEVKTRSQAGRTFDYVTARTVMNRLDNVLGLDGWWDRYRNGSDNSVICSLTIRLPDGTELTKEDTGGHAGMADGGDDDKSAFSDALKRSAVKFGISRYLYADGVPKCVADRTGLRGFGVPASMEEAAKVGTEPRREPERPQTAPQPPPERPAGNGQEPARQPYNGPQKDPVTGKQLFAHLKSLGERHGTDVVKEVNEYAKTKRLPARIIDFTEADVVFVMKAVNGRYGKPAQPAAPTTERGEAYEGPDEIPY